jgi:hypothetical protein
MRLQARSTAGREEIVQRLDVSESGLRFVGRQLYRAHERIFLLLPFERGRMPAMRRGTITWVREGLAGQVYGISYRQSSLGTIPENQSV